VRSDPTTPAHHARLSCRGEACRLREAARGRPRRGAAVSRTRRPIPLSEVHDGPRISSTGTTSGWRARSSTEAPSAAPNSYWRDGFANWCRRPANTRSRPGGTSRSTVAARSWMAVCTRSQRFVSSAGTSTQLYARTEWANKTMDAPSAMAMTFSFASGATGNCVWGFLGNPVLDEVRDTRLYGSEGVLISSRGHARLVRADGSTEAYTVRALRHGALQHVAESPRWAHPWRADRSHRSGRASRTCWSSFGHSSPRSGADTSMLRRGRVPDGKRGSLWRPRGAAGLFEGLGSTVRRIPPAAS